MNWEDRLAALQASKLQAQQEKPKRARKAAQRAPEPVPAKPKRNRTPSEWVRRVLDYIEGLPAGREITSDDLDVAVSGFPRKSNARGQVFHTASKVGLLDDTGRTVPTQAPEARGRRIRVWRRTEKKSP